MNHCMIDLETWGLTPGSALRSIGARMFDPVKKTLGETFYANISRASCEELGLRVDPKTEEWWAGQSAYAQTALETNQKHLFDVIEDFEFWWKRVKAEQVWSHGANFDIVLWEAVCRTVGYDTPWLFWNTRCCRTVLSMGNRKPMRDEKTQHHAIADCDAQIKALFAIDSLDMRKCW